MFTGLGWTTRKGRLGVHPYPSAGVARVVGMLLLLLAVMGPAVGMAAESVVLNAGESVVLPASEAVRVAVAEPRVADVAVVSRSEVLLTGRAAGETTLHIWDQNGLRTMTVRVYENTAHLVEELQTAINRPGLTVTVAGSRIILEGTLRDQNELNRVLSIAGGYSKDVLNLVSLANPLQVALKVHVIEVDKTGSSELGVSWGSLNQGVLEPGAFAVGEPDMYEPLKRLALIGAKIQAIADSGHATVLAAPTLLAMSGETAQFLAGGEIPVVMPQGDKYVVEWKEYGIQLEMKPVVDAQGYITVTLTPEVSTLDWANAIRVSTVALPAMKTRRTQTQVRVLDGDTLVLGGLLSRDENKQVNKLPILGDLPVIGRLFRSEKYTGGDTELLFLVTPHVLREGETLPPEMVVTPGGLSPLPPNALPKGPTALDLVPGGVGKRP